MVQLTAGQAYPLGEPDERVGQPLLRDTVGGPGGGYRESGEIDGLVTWLYPLACLTRLGDEAAQAGQRELGFHLVVRFVFLAQQLTPNDPAFQPGFEHVETSVAAVVGLGGYYGPYDTDPKTSPLAHARPDAPPFLLVHGNHDSLVPAESARRFAEHLRDLSTQPVIYAELPGGHHGFDLFHSLRFETVINAIEAFTAHLGRD